MKFLDIIKESFKGVNDQGSSRRITAFYFTTVLISSLIFVYEYLMIVNNAVPPDFYNILMLLVGFVGATWAATTIENIKKNEQDKDPETK